MNALSDWRACLLLFLIVFAAQPLVVAAERAEISEGAVVEAARKGEGTTAEKFAQKSLRSSKGKPDRASPTYIVTAEAAGGDQVSAESRKNKLYIEVRKQKGIGHAFIKIKSGKWPDMAQVRFFNFSRLEGLTARGGAKVDCIDGAASKRRTFDIDLLPLHVDDKGGLELNWIDAYRN